MAQYEHLRIVRLPQRLERRKQPGFGEAPERERGQHTAKLRHELDEAVQEQQRRRRPDTINPTLILRVQLAKPVLDEEWERVGLTVLSTDADRTLVLFSSSDEMQAFRDRLTAYSGEIPNGQKNAPYSGFVSAIQSIASVGPRDRIDKSLREAGFLGSEDFGDASEYTVDVELWEIGDRALRSAKVAQIERIVEGAGGEAIDRYIGPSISMLRVRARGPVIRLLLSTDEIASISSLPTPDVANSEAMDLVLSDVPSVGLVDDAPVVGIIDSGVNEHPLLANVLIGAVGVPEALGTSDEWSHGTRVAGIAAFGDLQSQLQAKSLTSVARLCSAKVVNDHGCFDDRTLVPSQMRKAITTLHSRFGARIFVIALADTKSRYDGGKVGAWAATLDELARELNILLLVAAGNREPRAGEHIEQAVTDYPAYLLEPQNRFFEPAGAMNVVTVGSLAHADGLDSSLAEYVSIRPITRHAEPSPFTRVGPGIGGSIKPDVVDFGGTLLFDPVVARLRDAKDVPSTGLLTLHHKPLDRLFASGCGTSFATPLVAFKASTLARRFPTASANLLRALLVGAADVPTESAQRLEPLGAEAVRAICGNGRVDLKRAVFSDDARVVLYAEDELNLDYFAVYEIPIPEIFQREKGRRTIRVTLAFDPPVRHTRADYAGVTMNFRLKRGCSSDLIFEHYRKRTEEEGRHPDIEGKFDCALKPGPQSREGGTLQTAAVEYQRTLADYGDSYYLVVRCESGWAASVIDRQRFAVVVELAHEAEIQLYERVKLRARLPA